MPYQAEISRENPTCILFVIDQSGSMDEITEAGRSKAAFVADVLNKTLYTLITSCSKSDGVRNYFDVGVIAYAGSQVTSGFGGTLSGDIVHPIQAVALQRAQVIRITHLIAQFLVRHDVAERISNVRVARHGPLGFRVVLDRRAFVLDRSQAEAGDLDVFLVRLFGVVDIEELRIFLRVLVVLTTPPGMDARPESFRV